MNITRRTTDPAGGRARARPGTRRIASAQDYPSQDIRLICGFPAGSGADIFVRYFAEKLRPIAGRTIIVENKVGANSNVATEYVARSKPDGHALYPFAGTTVAASMPLFKNPPVDVGKALQRRRHHQQSRLHAHRRRQEPVQDRRGPDRRDEEEGRQGELRDRREPRASSWARSTRTPPGSKPSRCSTAARPTRSNEMLERPARLRPARSDLRAGAGARGPPAHPRGLDRQAAVVAAGHPDHDGIRRSDGPVAVVGRDGAGRDAEADRRQDQPVVRPDRQHRGDQEVSRRFRRRSDDQHARARPTEMFQTAIKEWGEYVRIAKIPQM